MSSEIKVDTISENTSANGVSIDGLTIKDGGITATTGATVFNEAGADVDFRVESDSNTHMFFVDAGNNEVGVNTNDAESTFHVISTGTNSAGKFESNSANAPMVILNNSRADDGSEISLRFDRADTVQGAIGTTAQALSFWTNSSLTEQMRIKHDGDVFIGTTVTNPNPGIYFNKAGQMGIGNNNGTNGQDFLIFRRNSSNIGSVIQSGTTGVSYLTSSDYRLKENVETEWDATTRLKQLKPSRFNFISDPDRTVDGFLAHEVSDIVPEAISGEKDAMLPETYYEEGDEIPEDKDIGDVKDPVRINPQGIDQSKLVPLMVKTIQELEARIKTLEDA